MPEVPKDVLEILYQLLPGFLAAAIFYTLTAHPKGNSFERVVQALIFTAIIRGVVVCVEWVMYFIGRHAHWHQHHLVVGTWSPNSAMLWSLATALVLGVLASRNAHQRTHVFKWMQRVACSRRTAAPSQWYSAFHRYERWVILHLDGERRLKGWAEEWPDESDKGHFLLDKPEWVLDDATDVELPQVNRMLVPAAQVKIVEFVNTAGEVNLSADEMKKRQQPLLELLAKENCNGESKPVENGKLRPANGEQQRAGSDTGRGGQVDERPDSGERNGVQATVVTGPAAEEIESDGTARGEQPSGSVGPKREEVD